MYETTLWGWFPQSGGSATDLCEQWGQAHGHGYLRKEARNRKIRIPRDQRPTNPHQHAARPKRRNSPQTARLQRQLQITPKHHRLWNDGGQSCHTNEPQPTPAHRPGKKAQQPTARQSADHPPAPPPMEWRWPVMPQPAYVPPTKLCSPANMPGQRPASRERKRIRGRTTSCLHLPFHTSRSPTTHRVLCSKGEGQGQLEEWAKKCSKEGDTKARALCPAQD